MKSKNMSKEHFESDTDLPDLQLSSSVPLMMEYESVARNDGIAVGDVKNFFAGFIATQILGLFCIVFVCVWISKYLGGVGWSSSEQIFNYHPLFMVIGMIFIFGDGILVYRVLRNERKKILKLLHASLNGTAFVFAMFAQWAVFHFHNDKNIPNLYSLHSWIGFLTMLLFATQFALGFISFLYPGVTATYRRLLIPYHVYFGGTIFVMACATALLGITEKAFFSLDMKPGEPHHNYSDFTAPTVVLNLLGISIFLFAAVVIYLVSSGQYKRRPLPEEQAIHMQLDETSSVN